MGHIIGLGDRHGSNILVDQLTWGALHIDFGDVRHLLGQPPSLFMMMTSKLFCVSQDRSYLPEKVPFRLTRMMTNAFEVRVVPPLQVSEHHGSRCSLSVTEATKCPEIEAATLKPRCVQWMSCARIGARF